MRHHDEILELDHNWQIILDNSPAAADANVRDALSVVIEPSQSLSSQRVAPTASSNALSVTTTRGVAVLSTPHTAAQAAHIQTVDPVNTTPGPILSVESRLQPTNIDEKYRPTSDQSTASSIPISGLTDKLSESQYIQSAYFHIMFFNRHLPMLEPIAFVGI